MAQSLGGRLPPALVARLSQENLAAQLGAALPLVTVDAKGRPHPMLVSYLELLAPDAETIRLVIGGGSRSAANLDAQGVATLLVVEAGVTVYVKCRAAGRGRAFGDLARFDLHVEDVLEDSSAEWEEGAGVTAGIRYAPLPDLESDWARATLAALRAPSI